tara:strand:+ start:2651 stop:4906 length:2256 start_codon:yes stop_codon:yes gene_type:complete
MSLHQLTWPVIAPSLGLPQTNPVFPVQTLCPLCEGALSIYKDNKSGEEWAYCLDCQWSSSALQLAAHLWNVPLSVAVERLAELHNTSVTESEIQTYIKRCVLTHEKANKLWNKAQNNISRPSPGLSKLRTHFGLNIGQLSISRIVDGPARLFGIIHVADVKRLWVYGGKNRAYRKAEFFKGKGWEDVLVIPYFKAPGNVASILFVGREGKETSDQIFQTYARRGRSSNSSNASSGFAGLHSVIDYDCGHVILTSDVLANFRIQTRHFLTSVTPLPLVSWYDDPGGVYASNWGLFSGKRLVFWEWEPKASVLYQCMTTNADLVINVGPKKYDVRNISHWVRNQKSMLDIERQVVREAKPWKKALRNWIRTRDATEGRISTLLLECNNLSSKLAEEVRSAIGWERTQAKHYTRSVTINSNTYTDRGGVWYQNSTEKPLFDGNIRVDRVIVRDGCLPEYVGEIFIQDSAMPFRVKGRTRAKLNKAIWDVIESSGYFSERKAPCGVGLIQLALAFYKPDIWKGKDILGWDGTGFQLQNCKIVRGKYEKTPPELFSHQFEGPAGSSYRWRAEVVSSLLQATSLESTWAWSIVFGCINQILSPVAQHPVSKLVFEYDEYHNTAFTRILRLLGVPTTTEFWKHNWPAISIEKPTRHQKFKAVTVSSQDEIIKGRGIYLIKAPSAHELRPVNIPTAFRTVIPNFLAWFTLQDFATCFNEQSSWEKQTLSLVQKWATEREIKKLFPVFQAAIQLTRPPNH